MLGLERIGQERVAHPGPETPGLLFADDQNDSVESAPVIPLCGRCPVCIVCRIAHVTSCVMSGGNVGALSPYAQIRIWSTYFFPRVKMGFLFAVDLFQFFLIVDLSAVGETALTSSMAVVVFFLPSPASVAAAI